MKKLFVLLITFFVIGLATVFAQTAGAGESLITVTRKSSSAGAQSSVGIWVSATPIVSLKNGETQKFTLKNGKYTLQAKIGVLVSNNLVLDLNSKEYVLETVISGSGDPASKGTKGTTAITLNKVKEAALPSANANTGTWNTAALDTARNVTYLTAVEKDIILELNMVRSDPKKYAELYVKQSIGTNAAANELYNELLKTPSRAVLQPRRGLSQAAKDHVADTGPKGLVSHTGTNGSSLGDRINRYGTWKSGASENISFGYNTARDIVLQLLIDDGVEGRGHRKNIMDSNARHVGVAVGAHATYKYMCVQDFANDYTDK
jgi:uncharacterized protein YkwD